MHCQNETRILMIKYIKMKESIKKQEPQIFFEWCYNNYEVRTKLELKGRGIKNQNILKAFIL